MPPLLFALREKIVLFWGHESSLFTILPEKESVQKRKFMIHSYDVLV